MITPIPQGPLFTDHWFNASMKEIVDTIVRAEEEAKQRIAEAREAAKKITADAEIEARRLIETEREAAHQHARTLVDQAISETKAERASRLEITLAEIGDLRTAKADAMGRAVEQAVHRLTHRVREA